MQQNNENQKIMTSYSTSLCAWWL